MKRLSKLAFCSLFCLTFANNYAMHESAEEKENKLIGAIQSEQKKLDKIQNEYAKSRAMFESTQVRREKRLFNYSMACSLIANFADSWRISPASIEKHMVGFAKASTIGITVGCVLAEIRTYSIKKQAQPLEMPTEAKDDQLNKKTEFDWAKNKLEHNLHHLNDAEKDYKAAMKNWFDFKNSSKK